MTVWLINFYLIINLLYYLSIFLLMVTIWSINSNTVWLRTIFLAESTLKNIPFYNSTKLDLNPLYMTRLSISLKSLELKYLFVLPIYT